MARQANLLLFNVSLEILNNILVKVIEGASIVPEDLRVFKMGEYFGQLSGYYFMMSSKTFPLVKEGEQVKPGIIYFNKGVLTWRKS